MRGAWGQGMGSGGLGEHKSNAAMGPGAMDPWGPWGHGARGWAGAKGRGGVGGREERRGRSGRACTEQARPWDHAGRALGRWGHEAIGQRVMGSGRSKRALQPFQQGLMLGSL